MINAYPTDFTSHLNGVGCARRRVDVIQRAVEQLPQCELPLVHRFTPGLYVREIFMPKGALVVSKIHRTEHPYVISKGSVSVWDAENGVVHLSAPHCGITKPGTRRILLIHEDCVWTTFHPTNETDPAVIESQIIEPHDVALTDADAENVLKLRQALSK